ncbi:linoleate diol synthase [Rhizoctonia solani 123E]|uniref:Linoleate diol synthase n=1 Tax=Rhizoctonia solani 123E TaxID=1423351 RepID=A0A074RNA2_9AGAM|nr:linoleate diol synthase [Rhizoctonia solani 123E]
MSARATGISDEDIARVEEMVARVASSSELLDDRRGVMPQAFSVLSQIPPENPAGLRINNHLIRLLYETIPHPVATLLGEDRFRQADGSRNNIHIPAIGQAGTPYARTCQGRHPLPIPALPDSALVFDELLKSTGKRTEHPGKNSSLTFAFAAIVTHSLFRTDPRDWNKNNTSSYFDLSPLYGSNQVEQDAVRIKDGRGRLYPDTFSEGRLVFLPPASAALLVIWNRNHNYIADTILKINEQGRWKTPPPESAGERATQDDEIFQTARLINCGSFMSVILGDYVAGFLGLGRTGSSWAMQPFDPFKDPNNQPVGRGQGNHVSVEFNVLYRWHSVPSDEDESWTSGVFKKLFGDRPFGSLTLADFYEALGRLRKGAVHPDLITEPEPQKRDFGGIKRGPDGRFTDDDLAFVLQNATESVAHRYGARGTPEVFKVVEILGIEQARRWGVCSMNEFRMRMGLKPFATFEEWNRDPAVANAARKLYGTVDNLELYPGLHAEETMALGPGSGLCAGYTITRSILSDAIALIRGDRFFTTDFTPTNLTAWGIQDIARDPNNGAFGAYLPKLLMRNLPRHYPHNSAYSMFPFFTPPATRENLTKLKLADKYTFERPVATPAPKIINNISGIKYVHNNISKYTSLHGLKMEYVTNSGAMVLDEEPQQAVERSIVWRTLFPEKDDLDKHTRYYRKTIRSLIQAKSISYDNSPGNYVDIVGDIINTATVRWVSEHVLGISLKSNTNPNGDISEQGLYQALKTIYSYVYLPSSPHLEWVQSMQAKGAADDLILLIKASIERATQQKRGLIQFTQRMVYTGLSRPNSDESTRVDRFLKDLVAGGKSIDEVAGLVLGIAAGSTMNFAQAVAHTIDFYLQAQHHKQLQHIVKLAFKDDEESSKLLAGYYREAARLNPQPSGHFRTAAETHEIPQGVDVPSIHVQQGDLLFCSYKNTHLDPDLFPSATHIDPRRPVEAYLLQDTSINREFSERSISVIMREIFSLKNLRRAPGPKGIMRQIVDAGESEIYVTLDGGLSPLPKSLVLMYDR